MNGHVVGRSEPVEQIRSRMADQDPAPLVVVGEPGIGRTSVVRAAVATLDPRRTALIEVRPGNHRPFSSLRHLLGDRTPDRPGPRAAREVAAALMAHATCRRLVVVADDAHLADHSTMLVLQQLNRHAGTFVLLTHPDPYPRTDTPDSVDCLRYERGIQTVHLPPLRTEEVAVVLARLMGGPVRQATTDALHAATGGNPGLLHDILVRQDLGARMVRRDGRWRLDDGPRGAATPLTCRGIHHLLDAVTEAWANLALDQVDDLCRLATWSGAGAQVALTRAAVLLLRGRPLDALRVLDTTEGRHPHAVLLRAMCVAFGLRRGAEADRALTDAARGSEHRKRFHAYRVWLLAASGHTTTAARALGQVDGDQETGLFTHATHALVALAEGRAVAAVPELRRALLLAEANRETLSVRAAESPVPAPSPSSGTCCARAGTPWPRSHETGWTSTAGTRRSRASRTRSTV